MATAAKKKVAPAPGHRVEKTLYAALNAVEKAGKEIASLAREGQKRIKAHERKPTSAARTPKKVRKA